jgi:hypothetical protein
MAMRSSELLYFPHVVETISPEGSKRIDDMFRFHRRYGIQARTASVGHNESGCEIVHWFFAAPTIANFFKSEFG